MGLSGPVSRRESSAELPGKTKLIELGVLAHYWFRVYQTERGKRLCLLHALLKKVEKLHGGKASHARAPRGHTQHLYPAIPRGYMVITSPNPNLFPFRRSLAAV